MRKLIERHGHQVVLPKTKSEDKVTKASSGTTIRPPEEFVLKQVDSTRLPLAHEKIPRPEIYVDGKPVLVLDRRAARRTRADALSENLAAVEFMRDLAKTVFGPQRLIKLVLDQESKYPVTYVGSDLYDILKRIKLKHPAAQLVAGASIATYREKGDGCVSTMLLTADILDKCKGLLRKRTHANQVIDGLSLAYQKTLDLARHLVVTKKYGTAQVIEIAIGNALSGKLLFHDHRVIWKLLMEAVRKVGAKNLAGPDGNDIIDVKKVAGGSLADSQVVDGIALTQEIPHARMPRRVEGARIALIQGELRIPDKKIHRYQDYSFEFETPQMLSSFKNGKKAFLEGLAAKILGTDANVVLVQAGVDDFLFEYFADRGVLVIRRFPPVEFARVSRALGGNMVPNPELLTPRDLARANLVEERRTGKDKLVFVTGCEAPKTVDIILRGSNMSALDDLERVMKAAIKAGAAVANDPRLVWGGGAFEQELATGLYKYAQLIPDRRQLVIRAVAEAFESLPATLAETIGLKGLDITAELRHRHSLGEASAGIDINSGSVRKMSSLGLLDSLNIKLQIIQSAFEAAITILRVDDVVVAPDLPDSERAYLQRIKGTSKEELKKKDAYLG
jgi:archaeal chaperonin